jgi:hypothetical protein
MTTSNKDTILKTSRDKRRQIDHYLHRTEPRGARLTTYSIVFGGIAGLLTAAQVPFGQTTVDSQGILGLTNGVSLWRVLAIAATICSAVATMAGALYKQQEIAMRLAKTQAAAVKLEGLETSVELDLVTPTEAGAKYAQCIAEIPWVRSDEGASRFRGRYSIDSVDGEIGAPASGQAVSRAFRATGTVRNIDPTVHLWLAVEVNGLIWPKEGEICPESGEWSATVFEDGATDLFSLSLFAADQRAQKTIRRWLDVGKKTGTYRELRSLPGTRRVARVDGLHL